MIDQSQYQDLGIEHKYQQQINTEIDSKPSIDPKKVQLNVNKCKKTYQQLQHQNYCLRKENLVLEQKNQLLDKQLKVYQDNIRMLSSQSLKFTKQSLEASAKFEELENSSNYSSATKQKFNEIVKNYKSKIIYLKKERQYYKNQHQNGQLIIQQLKHKLKVAQTPKKHNNFEPLNPSVPRTTHSKAYMQQPVQTNKKKKSEGPQNKNANVFKKKKYDQ